MSNAIANQLFLAYLGRPADAAWRSSTATVLNGNQPSAALQTAFYNAAISEGVFATTDSNSSLVNKVFLQTFGYAATTFEQTAWASLVTNGTVSKESLAWTIFVSYLGATNVPDQYKLPTQSKLAAVEAYTNQLTNDGAANAALSQGGTAAAGARAQIATVNSQATAATFVTNVVTNVSSSSVTIGQTFLLTADANSGSAFTGTSANETFNALGASFWSIGDVLDGGAGSDTFNVTQTAAISQPLGATVSNIETINLVSGGTNTLTTTTGFSGLTNLNATGVSGATITSAATTAIAVTDTTSTGAIAVNGGSTVSVTSSGQTGGTGTIAVGATTAAAGAVTVRSTTTVGGTAGTIGVTGGTVVSVTQAAGGTAVAGTSSTAGAVTVTGNASTTTVSVADSVAAAGFTATSTLAGVRGHVNGNVTITDVNSGSATAAGVLTTVTLDSFAAATVNSGALTSLTLRGTGTTAAVTMGALTTPTVTALALNFNGATIGTSVTTPTVTTLNINSSTAASTVADLIAAAATTINVSGDALLTLTANTAAAATTISSSAMTAGGVSLGTALGTGVTFTGGAGADTIGIGTTTKAITMGAGNDRVITSTGLVGSGGSVAAGAGIDTIVFSTTANAVTAGSSSTFNSKFTGFETVELTNALSGTMNVAGINSASTVVLVAGGDNVTTAIIQDLASGGTVDTRVAGTGFVVNVLSAVGGTTDVLNLKLTNTAATTFTQMTAANVETININVADAAAGTAAAPASAAVVHLATLVATSATTVTVTGNNGLNLTNAGNVAVTRFDASGVVANDTAASVTALGAPVAATTDTAANLAVTFVSANTTATAVVTITGGAGNDTLTGVAALDTINGGAGNDTINGGAGIDTLNGGSGTDSITGGTGADNMTGGSGADTFIFAAGDTATPSASVFDIITDYVTGTDIVSMGAQIVLAAQGTAASGQAAISATGLATFNAADNTLALRLTAVASAFEAATATTTLEAAVFQFGSDSYLYITDNVAGLGANDVVIQLTGLQVTTGLTLTGQTITAIA